MFLNYYYIPYNAIVMTCCNPQFLTYNLFVCLHYFFSKKSLLRKFLMHNKGNTSIIMLSNNIQSFLKRNEDTSIKMDYLFTGLTKQTTSFRETIVNCALQLGKKFLEDISRRKLYSFWQFAQ